MKLMVLSFDKNKPSSPCKDNSKQCGRMAGQYSDNRDSKKDQAKN